MGEVSANFIFPLPVSVNHHDLCLDTLAKFGTFQLLPRGEAHLEPFLVFLD